MKHHASGSVVWLAALCATGLVACNGGDSIVTDAGALTSDATGEDATGGSDDVDATGGDGTGSGTGGSDETTHDGGGTAGAGDSDSVTDSAGALRSCKRGVAYGHHSDADLTALSTGVSWWYNWHYLPDKELTSGTAAQLGVQYVPMVWGGTFDQVAITTAIDASAGMLLGFNEPNFNGQANLSAVAAAERWPQLEAIAGAHGLRLASPAVNYCGGGCWDTDPIRYLDEFFAACAGCRVDVIAVHSYVGCNPQGDNHAQWLIDHLQAYLDHFDLPLWVTEFACGDAANEEEQRQFMADAVAWLEAEPRIERYAWFAGRADNVPHVDLLGAGGELTALGQAYVALPASTCQSPGQTLSR